MLEWSSFFLVKSIIHCDHRKPLLSAKGASLSIVTEETL